MSDTLNRLQSIAGEENVVEKPDFFSSSVGFKAVVKAISPDFLVTPANSDQVQQLVKMASEFSIPLIPVSSEAPHMMGGTTLDIPGAIILDLSKMKKILRVDRRTRLALIEPGVTWAELSAELAQHGLRITPPLLPKKGKSVIASLLDREPLISPKFQWNMNEPLRSMEIIFGTGERIFSGMGGHRGARDEDWINGTVPMTNAGPHQFDFMKMVTASQGTFGIVTWASVKVEVAATEEKVMFVEGQSVDALTDFLYKVVKFRFGDEVCIFNKKALSSILASNGDEIAAYNKKLSPWTALVNVKWGALRAKEKVAAQEADIVDIAQEFGLVPSITLGGMPVVDISDKVFSLAGDNHWKKKSTGSAKEIFFLSTLDKISGQMKKAAEVADRNGYSFADCPVYVQPLHQGVAVHCHIVLPLSAGLEESENLKKFYDELSKELSVVGAFYSRPYGVWSDIVYSGNAQHSILTKKMKNIFDPKNILNPGKLCF
jgi:FAD/FMN-containing dehydrogenase